MNNPQTQITLRYKNEQYTDIDNTLDTRMNNPQTQITLRYKNEQSTDTDNT